MKKIIILLTVLLLSQAGSAYAEANGKKCQKAEYGSKNTRTYVSTCYIRQTWKITKQGACIKGACTDNCEESTSKVFVGIRCIDELGDVKRAHARFSLKNVLI